MRYKKKIRRRKCKCGCGSITNYGKQYILGHNWKNKTHSNESKNKMSLGRTGGSKKQIRRRCECGCGGITNYGKIWISGHNRCGKKHSAETKKKMSKALQGRRLSTEHKLNLSLAAQNMSDEAKLNNSLALLKLHPDDEYCDIWRDKEYKKDIRKDYCENVDCKKDYEKLNNHHINLNKKDCHPNNIMTMCVSCHAILHRKLQRGTFIPADPKDYIIINRLDHVSYIHKKSHEIIKIRKII